MAYWVQETGKNNNSGNCRSFYCDYRSDIAKLPRAGIKGADQKNDTVSSTPCIHGSEALVLEDSSIWILGKDTNEWKEIGGG